MSEQPAVFITILDCDIERQPQVVAAVRTVLGQQIRQRPAFLGRYLLAILEGTCVITISTLQSIEDLEATKESAVDTDRHLGKIAHPSPGAYRLVHEMGV